MWLFAFAFVGAFISAHAVHAEGIIVTTNTNIQGAPTNIVLFTRANESARWAITSTQAAIVATMTVEVSNNMVNWATVMTTAPTARVYQNPIGEVLPLQDEDSYWRWNLKFSSNGPIGIFLIDADDVTQEIASHKKVPLIQINDDTVKLPFGGAIAPDRYKYTEVSTSPVMISSATQLTRALMPGSFITLTSTSVTGGVTLSALPTISTTTTEWRNGDRLILGSATSSMTFTDQGTTPGTGMNLGATQRMVGRGDLLGLLYMNGAWYEEYFSNNFEK